MKIQRVAKILGATMFMGMGAILAGTAYVSLYEKIVGESLSKTL